MSEQVAAEEVQEERAGKIKQKSRIDPKHGSMQDVGVHAFLHKLMKGEDRKQRNHHRLECYRNVVHQVFIPGNDLLHGDNEKHNSRDQGQQFKIIRFEKPVVKKRDGQSFHDKVNIDQRNIPGNR